MGWSKSDYEGRVCWQQNGQRVFDTAHIDMMENSTKIDHVAPINVPVGFAFAMYFLVGVVVGVLIGTQI